MKTKNNTATNLTASLDAVRAAAKAHSAQLAAPAAPAPPPEPAAKPAKNLVQCNVRLTPEARDRIRAVAHSCHMSEQELIQRWAMTLPAPEVPKMPWELQ